MSISKTNESILDEILVQIKKSPKVAPPKTLLSVIGRQYDEDLISRIIVYLIDQYNQFSINLINYYFKVSGDNGITNDFLNDLKNNVKPECRMEAGRADIFAEFKKGEKTVITLTIENKIRTWEHNTGEKAQTEVYTEYVKVHYPKPCKNVFLYLKPCWNQSEPKSKDFITINYSQIAKFIPEEIVEQDYIIKDFLEHIEHYLTKGNVTEMNDLDLKIMEHYSEYSNALKSFTKTLCKEKEELINTICDKIAKEKNINITDDYYNVESSGEDDLFFQYANVPDNLGIGSFRLYKRKWYKENQYYFYTEIKFSDGLLKNGDIKYQITLKDYSNKRHFDDDSKIVRDFKNSKKKDSKESSGGYEVYKCETYNTIYNSGKQWKEDFVNDSVKKLIENLEETEKIFNEFINFKEEKMK